MKPLRVAVFGVGHLGRHHARIYAGLEGVELAYVCDTDVRRAEEIAAQHGTRAVGDIPDDPIDAASIAVPTTAHHAVAGKLLERGVHCLVEKPIAATINEAQSLCDTAERHGCILQVGHIERYNPAISALERMIKKPRFIEVHRLAPFKARGHDVGVVLDLMIHDIDVLLALVRSPVARIEAVGVPVLTTTDDIANARIVFENGCVANVTASRVSPEEMRKIRIFEEDAYISLDYRAQEGSVYRKDGMTIVREDLPVEKDEPLKVELRSFVDCVREGRAPKVSGHHGTLALETAVRISRLIHG